MIQFLHSYPVSDSSLTCFEEKFTIRVCIKKFQENSSSNFRKRIKKNIDKSV